MDLCVDVLALRDLPHQVRKGASSFGPAADNIKVLTTHACKGLEFPLVALLGAGHMPAPGEFRASSSCARGLLAGDGGLTPNPGASLPYQRPKADLPLWSKRQDLA